MDNKLWQRITYPTCPTWIWVGAWEELVRRAKANGVRNAEHWDVRLAGQLMFKAGLPEDFETAADLLEWDPRTGRKLKDSRWFIFLR